MNSGEAVNAVIAASPGAMMKINEFAREVLRTRGGRMGSGMGTLLEGLWGYYVNSELAIATETGACELAWLSDQEYNDFACVQRDAEWAPRTRAGELFRIEAKSMNVEADESKAHFDELERNLGEYDQLVVIIWAWRKVDEWRVSPHILDIFVGGARAIAVLRDALHLARGGSFVDGSNCPDGCESKPCAHDGEPLNAAGKRERLSGPETCRPSARVAYAANFGGLVRMLKTESERARRALGKIRRDDDAADAYVTAIHRNFPDEERSQYTVAEWKDVAAKLGVETSGLSKSEMITLVREKGDGYRTQLRLVRGG